MRLRAKGERPASGSLPLFPLHTVLFPGGNLPLRIFEQRYIAMVKACIAEESPFGVCLLTKGDEVLRAGETSHAVPDFAHIGTTARIVEWDMPQLGILHVRAEGLQRFSVDDRTVAADGLITARVTSIPAEPARTVAETFAPLVHLLELIATRVGPQQLGLHETAQAAGSQRSAAPRRDLYDDASWLGYRLAELLPLPLTIKQTMLEVNDSEVRLSVLMRFLDQQGLL